MAATLSDLDIDSLLSAAEASLADQASNQTLAVESKQQSLVVPAKAPTSASAANGKAGKEKTEHKKEELTLRVPQLRAKGKKVCHFFVFESPSCMRKFYPKHNMTRRRAPVMGANPAPYMIFSSS